MASTIKAIVDKVIEISMRATSDAVGTGDKNYLQLIAESDKLVQLWNDYDGSMKEYNALVKLKRSQKRAIKKYSVQHNGAIDASMSRALQETREQLDAKQKENGFLETAKQFLIQIYKQVFKLQRLVNQISGQTIQMVYTSTRGSTMTTIKLRAKDFENGMYSMDIDRYGQLVLRYNTSEIEQVVVKIKERQDANVLITSSIQPKLEALVNEIIRRQDAAKAVNSPYLFWQLNRAWYKVKFIAMGDLIEAYTNALVNGEQDETLLAALQGNFDEQIDYMVNKYVAQVTNKSGFFEEDIQVGDTGQFYGVKSAGASLMGLKLIIRFAKLIVLAAQSHGSEINAKDIASLQRAFNRSSGRIKVEQVVNEEIPMAVQEALVEAVK